MNPYANAVLGLNPVAYWRLGEASGLPQDSAGANNATVIGGSPTYGVAGALAGDTNKAVTFTATGSQYFAAPDANALDLGDGPWTIEFWAKRASSGGNYRSVVDKGPSSPSFYFDKDSNKMSLERSDIAVNVTESGSTTDTNWHHWVGVRPLAGPTILYKDNVVVTALVGAVTFASTARKFYIGAFESTAGVADTPRFFFNGTIDEVAVYKSVLTPADVAQHYTLGTAAVGRPARRRLPPNPDADEAYLLLL